MKSTTGQHFIALDHVRAVAAFMVFVWHFSHTTTGSPIPFEYVPAIFPFAVLSEGHTGVALFMTLSGYLFAKLLTGKQIRYGAFLFNRLLRLVPLLALVLLAVGVLRYLGGEDLRSYGLAVARGWVFPSFPNGAWSVTTEFHFYLVFPLLLSLMARSPLLPLVIVLGSVLVRSLLFIELGEIQSLAFWTIIGRIDQFALGVLAFQLRSRVAGRHVLAMGTILGFMAFYWLFDNAGGFFRPGGYPSPSPVWVVLPTVEAVAYAITIAWYDNSFTHSTGPVSTFIGRIGAYSYSIYLLHFFVVFHASRFLHTRVLDLSNFYVACLAATVCYLLMVIPAYLSFRFIESPFLRLRKSHIVVPEGSHGVSP